MLWYVNWKLTNAQLELIAADVSVVDYGYGRKNKKKVKKGEFNDATASTADVDKARNEWLERYGGADGGNTGGKGGIAIGDVFAL
jgi:hypothetical protein